MQEHRNYWCFLKGVFNAQQVSQNLVRVAVLRNQDGLHIASTELKKIKRHKGFVLALCKEDFDSLLIFSGQNLITYTCSSSTYGPRGE